MTDTQNNRRKDVEQHMRQTTGTITELLEMDGVPVNYQTAIALMLIGMDTIISIKGKEHLARVMHQWADNILLGKVIK